MGKPPTPTPTTPSFPSSLPGYTDDFPPSHSPPPPIGAAWQPHTHSEALAAGGHGSRLGDPPEIEGDDPPPPYGEFPDEIQLSQDSFDAGARVTDDGRVNINLNSKSNTLTKVLYTQLSRAASVSRPAGPLPPAYIPPSLGGQPGQRPPPRLNVVIQIVGSRGDVQPFVALGQVLRDTYGHRVRLATHPTFRSFVEENGLEFFSVGGDPAELMAFMVKNPGLIPGKDALKSGEIGKRRRMMEEIISGCWRSCSEAGDGLGPPPRAHARDAPMEISHKLPGDPNNRPFVADAIIANPPSFAHIHVAEKLGIPLHLMFTMPWSPTRAFPHPLANILSSNTDDAITNYVTYSMVEMMTWQGLGDVINRFREGTLGLEPLSLLWAPGLLTRLLIPYTYCWSPALIPKPNDWEHNIDISGFFFLDLASSYTPDPALAAFLAAGPPPVYVGFGSIVVDDPNHLTRLIFDAIHLAKCRALVSKGWGGIGADEVGLPEGVFMLGNCPHDWLFQRVSCVVHHGGAGTTAAGIKAGKPTVVVPFFGDQPFWGAMIARAGAGPDPIPYKLLTADKLAAAIAHCLKPETLARATELGGKIREEKGVDVGGKSFHDHLDCDAMRCSLAPSRVAVWRIRRTKFRLGALSAEVLVRQGHLKYSDMKLYRSKEYITEDQPWDPISGAATSLVGDFTAILLGITDIPRNTYKARAIYTKNPAGAKEGENKSENESEVKSEAKNTEAAGDAGTTPADASVTVSPATPFPSDPRMSVSQISLVQTEPVELPATPLTSPRGRRSPSSTFGSPPPNDLSPEAATPSHSLHRPGPLSRLSIDQGRARSQSRSGEIGGNTIDAAIHTTKGVSRVVSRGVKTPMNFCLGLAKGFRNAPKLYNDDMVRPQEKVIDVASGFKVAGKEFGLGLYDGISGLVTQPWRGAQKQGAAGFVKGMGKGIGGFFLKSAGALVAIPAYTMQGIHAQVKNAMATSLLSYITTSRVIQGREEYDQSSTQERDDIVARWNAAKYDLKEFQSLKTKQNPKSWQKKPQGLFPGTDGAANLSTESLPTIDDSEFEHAIQASVAETSRGNSREDEAVERAIRESVVRMRREGADLPVPVPASVAPLPENGYDNNYTSVSTEKQQQAVSEMTDEEYQALIQRTIERSMAAPPPEAQRRRESSGRDDHELQRAIKESRSVPPPYEDDEDLRRVLEQSRTEAKAAPRRPQASAEEEEELLRRAMEESAQSHAQTLERRSTQQRDDEFLLEYAKMQSLAEEEHRRSMTKGKMRLGANDDDDDDDDDLRRALEESLRMGGGGRGGEGSGFGRPGVGI